MYYGKLDVPRYSSSNIDFIYKGFFNSKINLFFKFDFFLGSNNIWKNNLVPLPDFFNSRGKI